MNAQELREQHPEAAAALIQEALQEADTMNQENVSAESKRLVGIYGLMHGAEASEKFAKLAESGITVEQAEALGAAGLMPEQAAAGDDEKAEALEAENRQKILDALEDTGQDNPGAGAQGTGPADFMAAVEGIMAANDKLTKVQAMQRAAKAHPELHKAYLDQANSNE